MSGYGCFARYYDALTKNVDYAIRAGELDKIIRRYVPQASLVLDLACGTGSLSFSLAGLGYEVIGVDSSADMLSAAMAKSAVDEKTKEQSRANRVMFLNQRMDRLDLYGTVDATVCMLDSLNHVGSEKTLLAAFKKVSLFTNPGGVFVFDVNTHHKHREVLGGNTFVYDLPDVFCCWQNVYNKDNCRVDITLDFFAESGDGRYTRETEKFSEWAYPEEFWLGLLEQAGFLHLETIDGDTFGQPQESSQRLLYVAKKV